MSLSYDAYDALLKDWWESNDPRDVKDIHFLGFAGFGEQTEIQFTIRCFDESTAIGFTTNRSSILRYELLKFVKENL